jgi:hypothetical protein
LANTLTHIVEALRACHALHEHAWVLLVDTAQDLDRDIILASKADGSRPERRGIYRRQRGIFETVREALPRRLGALPSPADSNLGVTKILRTYLIIVKYVCVLGTVTTANAVVCSVWVESTWQSRGAILTAWASQRRHHWRGDGSMDAYWEAWTVGALIACCSCTFCNLI